MNEEALKDAYDYFYRTGYDGNILQFRDLLNTNKEAVQDAYNHFVETGYEGDINSFKDLVGVQPVKKKEPSDTFGPSLEEDSKFKSILGSEFDRDDQEYAEYLEKKNKEAISKIREIRPDLDFPTKEEYYGIDSIPELKETTVFKDITDLSAAEKKANAERAKIAQEHAEGKRELTPQQSLINTLHNSLGRLATTDDKARYLYGIVSGDMEQIGLAEKELSRVESYSKPVAEFTQAAGLLKDTGDDYAAKKEIAPEVRKMFGAAFIDAFSSVVTSAIQSRLTGGLGLASDMIGESIRSYNKEKAIANNVSEEELYNSGEAEIIMPGIIGFFAYRMERFGLGAISKAVKSMPKGVKKFFANFINTSTTEGVTEGGQFVAEELNKFIGSKDKINEEDDLSGIGDKFIEIIGSREFRESIYKGVAGGGGAYSGGRAYTAMAGVKTDEQTKKQDDAFDKLIKLKDARQKTKLTQEEDQAFTAAEEEAKKDIRDVNEEAAETLNNLEESEVKEIEQLQREQQSLNNMLINTVNSKNLTEEQKEIVIKELQKKFKNNVDRVNEIKKQVKTTKTKEEKKDTPKGFDLTSEEDVKSVEQKYDPTTEADKFTIIEAAKRTQAALQKAIPGLNIVIHDTPESFVQESGAGQVGRGAFNRKQNTIHINLQDADRTTLAHEAFHAMLRNVVNKGRWESETKKMFEAVLPDIKGTTLEKELEDFISNYDANVQNEERLTQMFARMAETETEFKATTRHKVKDWINKVARVINRDNVFTDKDIQDLEVKRVLNTLAGKVAAGEEIEAIEVAKLDSEVREKLIKGEDIEQGSYIGNIVIDKNYKEEDRDIALQLKERTIDIKNIVRGSLNDLVGKNVFGMAADRAAVGNIEINGKEYNMMGGPLYAYLNQGGWAFSAKSPATRVLNNAKATDGIAIIMLQAKEGILGNQMTYNIVVDQFRTAVERGQAKESDLIEDINKALTAKASVRTFIEKQKSKKNTLSTVKSLDDFDKILRVANFAQRKDFFLSLLGGTGLKTKSSFEKKYEFLSTDKLIDAMTDPAFKNLEYGDLVAAVQFDKDSDLIDTRETNEYDTHPSYPFILKGKPLMVFNKPVDTRKVFGDFISTKGQVLGEEDKPSGAYTTMQAQPKAKIKEVNEEVSEVALQKIDSGLSKASGTTQVATTVGSYRKVAQKIKKGSVLDYGAGLGLGTDAMSSVLGKKVDSYELNAERWKGKRPVTYTEAKNISKKYDNIVSLNVLNVVPKDVRNFIVDHIASRLNDGGRAYISTRKFKGDIDQAKNFKTGPEDKSYIIQRKKGGETVDVYQKGFDGNELVEYVQGRLGELYFVERDNSFGSAGVIVTKSDVAMQKNASSVLKGFTKDSKDFIKGIEKEKKKKNVWNAVFDRQSDLKKIFSKGTVGAKEVYNSIVTKAGASAYAKEKFKEAEAKIYKGISPDEEDTLNAIILAKRVIAINKKRIEKQVEAAKYAKEYGKTIPKSKAKDIDKNVLDFYYDLTITENEEGQDIVSYKLKDFNPYSAVNKNGGVLNAASATLALEQLKTTNPKLYNDLDSRAEIYFDEFRGLLKELYDSGRINKGAYEYFRDVNYSPIRVLQQIFKDNKNLTQEDIDKTAALYGIPAKDILALTDKNEMTILTDSRWILAMSTAAIQRKRFNNVLMNKIYDTINLTPIAFEEFITLDRKEAKEKGFVPVSFFRKGEPMKVYMDEQYARQLMDIRVDNKVLDGIEKFSGGKLLKFFATGGNVAFILSNAPIDLMNVALFTDVYNRTPLERLLVGGKYVGLAKVTGDFVKNTTKKMISDVRGKGEYKKLYEEFLRYGGGMDYLSQTGISKINKGRDTNYDRLLGVLSYLGTTSEQAVRVSVFDKVKKDKIKEYIKKNGVKPTGKSLENILFEAAAQARETIDFAQGGDLTKQIDKIVPYTNATIQGVRRPIDYAKQNPIGFTSALAHVAGIGVAIPGLNFLLAGLAGDDEEPKEVLKELREMSSKYEKANYYQLLNPFDLRDEKGNLNYIRIRKLPTISLFSTPTEDLTYSYFTGKDFDKKLLMQSARSTVPFTGGIVDLAGSNPAVSAFVAYYANYDLFRGKEIVRKDANRPIKAYAEGMEDDDVSVLYKAFATLGSSVGVDVSPKRMQAAIEKVITSPTTNPLVGLLYGGGEALKQLKDGNADIGFILKPLKGFFDGISRRAYRQTNPNVKKYNEKDVVLDLIEKNNTESYLKNKRANDKMNDLIDQYGVGNLPKTLPSEFKDYIKENFDPNDQKRMIQKYTRRLRSSVIDGIFFDIAYERDPKNQALYLQYLYGPTMEREEYVELQRFIKTITGRKISRKALLEYKNLN